MASTRRNTIIYWILTLLVVLPMAGSGIPELFTSGPAAVVASMMVLGYPLYLMKILGLAKLLGGITLVGGRRFPRLKEWAYAGYTFDLLGATASHLLAGDGKNAPAPFILFLVLMGSYFLWSRQSTNAQMVTRARDTAG